MQNKFRLVGFLLVFGSAWGAWAMAGRLTSPNLAFPATFPESSRTNFLAALTAPEYKFLEGDFVNAVTRLRYGGETKGLNLFLRRLAQCPGVKILVSFAPPPLPGESYAWLVTHNAWGDADHLEVRINLRSPQIQLEELSLPEIHGAPLPAR